LRRAEHRPRLASSPKEKKKKKNPPFLPWGTFYFDYKVWEKTQKLNVRGGGGTGNNPQKQRQDQGGGSSALGPKRENRGGGAKKNFSGKEKGGLFGNAHAKSFFGVGAGGKSRTKSGNTEGPGKGKGIPISRVRAEGAQGGVSESEKRPGRGPGKQKPMYSLKNAGGAPGKKGWFWGQNISLGKKKRHFVGAKTKSCEFQGIFETRAGFTQGGEKKNPAGDPPGAGWKKQVLLAPKNKPERIFPQG